MIPSLPLRMYRVWLKEMKHLLPATIYFFCAFNLISFTTNLMIRSYWFHLTGFLVATGLALLVGKAVLVANKIKFIDRFRGAPLIQPIIYKTVFYTVIVLIARMLELLVHFALDADGFGAAFHAAVEVFTWRRFAAIQIWVFTCFLIFVTANELGALLGEGQWRRLFFHHRSSEFKLTRRQHVRALLEISRLAEATSREKLFDLTTPQGARLAAIVDSLRRRPA
jgi:hypothetical protein